jgi:acyl-CoA synthetase (AMP-forming)/AMP-acid ligase II
LLFDRFFDAIDHWALTTPDAPATWFRGDTMTYRTVADMVDRFARALVGAGVQKGDIVAVLTTSRPEFLVALAAIHKAGAVYVGINPNYTQREQSHVVTDARPVMIFSLAEVGERSYADDVAGLAASVDSVRGTYRLDDGPTVGCLVSMDTFLAHADSVDADALPSIDRMDPSTIVYTSGSSGAPKGAVLPHYGISYGAYCDAREMAVQSPRVMCNLPANHTGCIVDVQGSTIVSGGMVAYSEKFDPAEMLRLVEELRLTNLQHVPTVLQLLAMHPDFTTRDLSSLRLVAWGGAALPIEFVRAYHALGVRLFTIYGMTETCGNATFTQPDDTPEILAGTVGRPNPDADVLVADDEGNEVPLGEEGEVWYRHEAKLLYYLNNPEATAKTLTADGFLRTGDVAVRLASGHLRLVGRRSEMFKSGGLNVYPREIELALEEHPNVALAAVVGVKDPVYAEVGAAFLICEPGKSVDDDELRAWCKSRLAGYKVPKTFHVREELPLLPIGKVDKQALRRELS